jgi:septal ring factor EnvC (AmiA/AmiB activator)
VLLKDPRFIQFVNKPTRVAGGTKFSDFGFRVVPHLDEITLELDADPSPTRTYEELRGARKALISKQQQFRREDSKLRIAQGQLAAAENMPTKTPTQRRARQSKINKAKADIARSTQRLNQLGVQIPADQKAVADWEAKWKAIEVQLQPVKDCVFYGELCR